MNIHFAPNTPYFGRMDAQTDRDAIVPSNEKSDLPNFRLSDTL